MSDRIARRRSLAIARHHAQFRRNPDLWVGWKKEAVTLASGQQYQEERPSQSVGVEWAGGE
jgi:hypothetical protein